MNILVKLVVAAAVVFVVLQAIRPGIPVKPATAEVQVPAEVRQILEKDCYSCHSDQRRLAWFDEIVPAYWLVRHDILTAREHLDFSTLGAKPAGVQTATLYEAVNMIRLGAMPLPQFVRLHPEAKVTAEELATLEAYLAPWKTEADGHGGAPGAVSPGASAPGSLEAVQPELDGFPFDPSFEGWTPISTTDRGDNHTFRFILGNKVAVEAARTGNISPWPDGAAFAKVTWQKEPDADGLVYPGKFIQVELMLKGAKQYKDAEGWGWGRWRGMDLKPYGKDARFVTECTSCHLPVRGNDYVYTLPMTAAKVDREEVVNNSAAALPASLPYQPLGWRAITMFVDPATHTTATLYGNDTAMQGVQARGEAPVTNRTVYPAGAVLALVTWVQREDPHWFGARIPDGPQSVEFVQVAAGGLASSYRRFAGAELGEDEPSAATAERRKGFVLGLAPARMP